MKISILIPSILFAFNIKATEPKYLLLNQTIKDVDIKKDGEDIYLVRLMGAKQYKVLAMQKGIDLMVQLLDSTKKVLLEKDSPNGLNGEETFDFTPLYAGKYFVSLKWVKEDQNSAIGKYDISLTEYTEEQMAFIKSEKIRKEKAIANARPIETIDVENFYKAFDLLSAAKTNQDSVNIIRDNYFLTATGGLVEAIDLSRMTPERTVKVIAARPKYFNSIRKNILSAKNLTSTIENISKKYAEVYPNFKSYKVCFIVGTMGGADVFTSPNFVTVNCENVCHTNDVDVSELNAFQKSFVVRENDITQQIVERVGHEATHFQQKNLVVKTANGCPLLNGAIIEGICDYMATVVTGKPVVLRKDAYDYVEKNEKEVWAAFKADMCSPKPGQWLFNSAKDGKPGNLGFGIALKIITAYYAKGVDKKKGITEIMEMNDPVLFLEKSGYGK
jgi:hypothetical protein